MNMVAVGLLVVFWGLTLFMVNRALHNTGWSLADALSEDGRASSSRLIAFIFAVIAAGFLMGVSLYATDFMFRHEKMPPLDGIFQLLGTMTTMFIPYGINRFSSVLENRGASGLFSTVSTAVSAQPGAASQLQIINVQGTLVAGQTAVITVLGTGIAPGMTAALLNPATGMAVGQVNGVSVQTPVQAQITITPGPGTKGQSAVLQLSNITQKVNSPTLLIN